MTKLVQINSIHITKPERDKNVQKVKGGPSKCLC